MNLAVAPAGLALEQARAEDFEALHALRLRAMRKSLADIGRLDETRVRARLAESFEPECTQWILEGGQRVGFLVSKTWSHALVLKHFYIDPPYQGRGLGGRMMQAVIDQAQAAELRLELVALKGSDANRFYLRHGFAAIGEGEWDIDYVRLPQGPSVQVVRSLWAFFQARNWAAARDLLHPQLVATWWTSGERFTSADAFIQAQATYPEGWSIRVVECQRLEDGRVFSLVRVDHAPNTFYASSFFRLDNGVIMAVDEYWATAEAPPAWRDALNAQGRERFDGLDDPRAVLA